MRSSALNTSKPNCKQRTRVTFDSYLKSAVDVGNKLTSRADIKASIISSSHGVMVDTL